jgi:Holliday junction resolvase RusA-like endonuclease
MIHSNHAALMAWRESVASAAKATGFECLPLHEPCRVKVEFWLPRPKTVKRAWPTAKGDLDKHLRSIGDALTGVLFVDDGQVVVWEAVKRYCDNHPVGAVITVTGVDEQVA